MPHEEDYGVIKEMKRAAAKQAPHAYAMRQQPAKKNPGTGRSVSPGWTAGGSMNTGGKRRPGRLGPG